MDKEFIEIPFDAIAPKRWEYTIPEGFEAEIKDGKVLLKEKESEDERIIKKLQEYVKNRNWTLNGPTQNEVLAWLEKQKENVEKEYVFRPSPGTDINSAVLQAIRRANEGDRLVLAFNGAYIPVRKGCNANKIVDIYDAFIEKQKEQDKCPEYCVRSHCIGCPIYEKQKDYNKLYGDIAESEWFKKAYEGKSLGCDYEQKEQKSAEIDEYEIIKKHITGDSLSSEVNKRLTECGWYVTEQKPAEWSEDYREEDIQTRFAFYTYKDDPSELYLSNVFVEEASRNHGLGTRILRAAEKVAETIGATTICLKVKMDSPANGWYRKNGYGYVCFEDGYDWLEKNLEYLKPKKEVEWSEEEKNGMFSDIIVAIRAFYMCGREDLVEYFKSLRPSWKPSEEQMGALNYAYCELFKREDVGHNILGPLQNLIDTLSKL